MNYYNATNTEHCCGLNSNCKFTQTDLIEGACTNVRVGTREVIVGDPGHIINFPSLTASF